MTTTTRMMRATRTSSRTLRLGLVRRVQRDTLLRRAQRDVSPTPTPRPTLVPHHACRSSVSSATSSSARLLQLRRAQRHFVLVCLCSALGQPTRNASRATTTTITTEASWRPWQVHAAPRLAPCRWRASHDHRHLPRLHRSSLLLRHHQSSLLLETATRPSACPTSQA